MNQIVWLRHTMVIYNSDFRLSRYDSPASVGGSSHSAVSPLGCDWHGFRKDISKSDSNGFLDRCTDETAYSTGTKSVARALEVLVNQYDWLPGPLTFRVVKRLKFSTVGIVGITLG